MWLITIFDPNKEMGGADSVLIKGATHFILGKFNYKKSHMAKVPLFVNDRKYYFILLYGVDLLSVEALLTKNIKVVGCRLFSPKFEKIRKKIPFFNTIINNRKDLYLHYRAELISYLIYSDDEVIFDSFCEFLQLIMPSKISMLLSFHGHCQHTGRKCELEIAGGISSNEISDLYWKLKPEDIFYIYKDDYITALLLLKEFLAVTKTDLLKRCIGLYFVAYQEEKAYVKYIVLMMLIESLVNDTDNNGVSYKIKRTCALLVGADEKSCDDIYTKTGYAYEVRSKLVHAAKDGTLKGHNLLYMQSLISEILISLFIADFDHKNLFTQLTKLGYGSRENFIRNKKLKSYKGLFSNTINFKMMVKTK